MLQHADNVVTRTQRRQQRSPSGKVTVRPCDQERGARDQTATKVVPMWLQHCALTQRIAELRLKYREKKLCKSAADTSRRQRHGRPGRSIDSALDLVIDWLSIGDRGYYHRYKLDQGPPFRAAYCSNLGVPLASGFTSSQGSLPSFPLESSMLSPSLSTPVTGSGYYCRSSIQQHP